MESEMKKRNLEERKALSLEKEQIAMHSSLQESEVLKMKEELLIAQKEVEM